MRPSNKSRNRNKGSNRRGSVGNNINRVFESAGPEGRVRGTPQQIIDKYLSLTYDAQLSGDRVAAENFQQHAEHYARLLTEAQKEIADKQLEQNANVGINRVEVKPSDEILEELPVVNENSDKEEEKVVKFGKSLDKKNAKVRSDINKEKTEKRADSRKEEKKVMSKDTENLEI